MLHPKASFESCCGTPKSVVSLSIAVRLGKTGCTELKKCARSGNCFNNPQTPMGDFGCFSSSTRARSQSAPSFLGVTSDPCPDAEDVVTFTAERMRESVHGVCLQRD